uniref:Uncharacterized protein n=1 Tax=Rhizophora mucronata TaxID=61149 RepID=A0A2P2PAN6_RHIMU
MHTINVFVPLMDQPFEYYYVSQMTYC